MEQQRAETAAKRKKDVATNAARRLGRAGVCPELSDRSAVICNGG